MKKLEMVAWFLLFYFCMKTVNLLSLLLLFTLSSYATQVSPKTAHRRLVLEALARVQCVQIYQPKLLVSAPATLTRGVSRGARTIELVPKTLFHSKIQKQIDDFSLRFRDLIKIEFGLPFGGGDNLSTYQFLIRDQSESKEKLYWTQKLGFKWSGSDEPSQSPDQLTLARNYKKALEELGIDESSFFVPAMVFYRDISVSKNGVQTPSKEYRFVDPLKEDINSLDADWKILSSDVQFNLPFSAMMEGMKQGMFPMLDAVHDIYHFVAFLRFTEGTKALRASINKTTIADYSSGFKRREYWLTEALSIMLPDAQMANAQFLKSHRSDSAAKSLDQIRAELKSLKESDLIEYSLKLSVHLGNQLRDVSGGNSSPAEKWFYLGEVVGVSGKDLVDAVLPAKQDLSSVQNLSESYFRNGPVVFAGNPKPMTNETATFSFSVFNLAHRLLAQALSGGYKNHFDKIPKRELINDLVEYSARSEFLLRSEQPPINLWYSQFISRDMLASEYIGQMLRTLFDNDIVSRFYLGEGEKRPGN